MIGRWIFLRDGRLTRRTWLVLAGVFVLALIALLPLRLVLGLSGAGERGLAARSVEGPAWSGRIGELRAGPLPLGTVDAGLKPLPLLVGRGELWLRRAGGADAAPFTATASAGAGRLRLREVDGTVALPEGLGALPVASVGFSGFRLDVEGGRCLAADGTLSLTLAPVSALLPNAMVLSGKAQCNDGVLQVPMQGPGGTERMLLRLGADGNWTADLVLTGLPVEVSGPLLDAGFSARQGGGIGLRASGRF